MFLFHLLYVQCSTTCVCVREEMGGWMGCVIFLLKKKKGQGAHISKAFIIIPSFCFRPPPSHIEIACVFGRKFLSYPCFCCSTFPLFCFCVHTTTYYIHCLPMQKKSQANPRKTRPIPSTHPPPSRTRFGCRILIQSFSLVLFHHPPTSPITFPSSTNNTGKKTRGRWQRWRTW